VSAGKRRPGKSAPGSRGTRTPRKGTPGSRAALERQTLEAFRTLFASARVHDADVRRVAGIPGSQLWALSEIARAGGLSVNDLAENMALHQTTASNLVNGLSERKLIRRTRDAEDQRIVRLHVTTDGKRMLLRAPGPYTGLLVDGLRHLDEKQLARLHKDLASLLGVMRRTATTAAGETLLGE